MGQGHSIDIVDLENNFNIVSFDGICCKCSSLENYIWFITLNGELCRVDNNITLHCKMKKE